MLLKTISIIYRVAQKSRPLPNDKKIVLKPVINAKFFINFDYKMSTRI